MSRIDSIVLDNIKAVRHVVGYVRGVIVVALVCRRWAPGTLMIGRTPLFEIRGTLSVGAELRTRSAVKRSSFSTGRIGVLEIGDRVSINQGTVIHAEKLVKIGNRVSIGDQVRIHDTNFHAARPGEETKIAPVHVDDDVWIGSNVTVLPGVQVGRGAVIGAGAVVSKSVQPGSIVVPAAPRVVETVVIPVDYRRR